jgi:hypothetical protein
MSLPIDCAALLVNEGQQVRRISFLFGACGAQREQFGAQRLLLGFKLRN